MLSKRGYYDAFLNSCSKCPSSVAVRQFEDKQYKTYTYSEQYGICEYLVQTLQQLEFTKGVIGLVSQRNLIIPSVIATVHKCSSTFMFIDPSQDVETISRQIQLSCVIYIRNNDIETLELFFKEPVKSVPIYNLIIDFYSTPFTNRQVRSHAFIVQTSGSTGEPKHIQVPMESLQPNIHDLTKTFKISSDDVIYFSTPLTFDPSMIELLLAFSNAASLLIAPMDVDILFPENKQNSITFWQTTPSNFFQNTDNDIRNKILSAKSTLRILAFGGEPLYGIKRLQELKHPLNKTRIFTLYGVTEMSCWACVAELDLEKIQDNREIPLGNCLSETQLLIKPTTETNKDIGEIILRSKTRRCILIDSNKGEEISLDCVNTGDLGERRRGNIYFRGRKDDVIKRFGNKVNLQLIESTVMLCPKVKCCSCVWLPKPMLLVVYFLADSITSREISDFLKCKLDEKHWPDKIIRVDNMPVNIHGKISRLIMSKLYIKHNDSKKSFDAIQMLFLKELKRVLAKDVEYAMIKHKTFLSVGGTSFLALSMCNRISQNFPEFGKFILPHLLTNEHCIEKILEIAEKEMKGKGIVPKKRMKPKKSNIIELTNKRSELSKKSLPESITSQNSAQPECITVTWKQNTAKCVDASPTLWEQESELYVSVGSHSGQVVVVEVRGGHVPGGHAPGGHERVGRVRVGARVEASVLCCTLPALAAPCGLVGAYDGSVTLFTLQTARLIWRTNVGTMVKSKATFYDKYFYVAAYDGRIYYLNMEDGNIIGWIPISDQGISADLVIAKNEFILVGTLSGVCASVHTETNTLVWRSTLNSPIFANPALYDNDKYVVFAEVNGEIHCHTVEKGIKIWRYNGAEGNIFSSLHITLKSHINWQMVFGCHDNNVYCLSLVNFIPVLQWKCKLSAPVYSTPCSLTDKLILAISNDGKVHIIESNNGVILVEYQLPDKVFSSPAVKDNNIFVGCRDDNLYCLKYDFNNLQLV